MTFRATSVVVALAGAACGSSAKGGAGGDTPAPGAPAPAPDAPEPAPAEAPAPSEPVPAAPPAPKVIASMSEDLDGDGKLEAIVVTLGEVKIGDHTVAIPEITEDSTAEILDIDRKTRSRELALSPPVGEDDLSIFLFTYDGKTVVASDKVFFGNKPAVAGNGKVIATIYNCGAVETHVYRLKAGKLVKTSSKTKGKFDPNKCAACPHVAVLVDGKFQHVGEILRDVRGAAAFTRQSLAISDELVTGSSLIVQISEVKPETTHLDRLFVTVGGREQHALGCAASSRAAWCAADGEALTLQRGDARTFEFDLGARREGEPVLLWAAGYYDPEVP